MKKMFIVVAVALSAAYAAAQSATVTAPVTVTQQTTTSVSAKLVVAEVLIHRDPIPNATIVVEYQATANSAPLRQAAFQVPRDQAAPGTEFADLMTAMGSARANETGTASRRMNFRVLGYLVDSGQITGVTLVP